jgi:hypothetical protein
VGGAATGSYEGSLARNSRKVCALGLLGVVKENSLRATVRMPLTADLRLITFSLIDETGDRSSTDVGGVEGAELFVDVSSRDDRGVEAMLRWCWVALVISSFCSLDVAGLSESERGVRGLKGGMLTTLGERQMSPWLTGFIMTAWAQ